MSGQNLASCVSPTSVSQWAEGLGEWRLPASRRGGRRYRVLAIDCGAKHNILRNLAERGCDVQVVPHDITPDQVAGLSPEGLFISNGPGDPAAVEATIATLRAVAGSVPTFGICLGHQLLAALPGRPRPGS